MIILPDKIKNDLSSSITSAEYLLYIEGETQALNTYVGSRQQMFEDEQSSLQFYEDLNRIKYIKRLFRKYKSSGELKERLILNHIIIFYNVFGIEAATNILFFKIEDEFWPLLKTFLVYLDMFPENDIEKIRIPLENAVIEVLRKI